MIKTKKNTMKRLQNTGQKKWKENNKTYIQQFSEKKEDENESFM